MIVDNMNFVYLINKQSQEKIWGLVESDGRNWTKNLQVYGSILYSPKERIFIDLLINLNST